MTNTPTTRKALAATIKGRLRGAGITDEAAAEALGIERSTLNRKINGLAPLKDVDLLGLAALLGVDMADLFKSDGEAA